MQLGQTVSVFVLDKNGGSDTTGTHVEGKIHSLGVTLIQIQVETEDGPFHVSIPKKWCIQQGPDSWLAPVRIIEDDS
jgi:hypothetical protein